MSFSRQSNTSIQKDTRIGDSSRVYDLIVDHQMIYNGIVPQFINYTVKDPTNNLVDIYGLTKNTGNVGPNLQVDSSTCNLDFEAGPDTNAYIKLYKSSQPTVGAIYAGDNKSLNIFTKDGSGNYGGYVTVNPANARLGKQSDQDVFIEITDYNIRFFNLASVDTIDVDTNLSWNSLTHNVRYNTIYREALCITEGTPSVLSSSTYHPFPFDLTYGINYGSYYGYDSFGIFNNDDQSWTVPQSGYYTISSSFEFQVNGTSNISIYFGINKSSTDYVIANDKYVASADIQFLSLNGQAVLQANTKYYVSIYCTTTFNLNPGGYVALTKII